MQVDFNNLRKQTAFALDDLTNKLNNAILKKSQYALPNDVYHNQEVDIKGYVLIDSDDIQRIMDELRSNVAAICYTYNKDDKDFKDVMGEVEENGGLSWFNEEPEEETNEED